MTTERINELADEAGVTLLRMDGYDNCVIGIAYIFNGDPFLVYDREKVVKKLMDDGASYEEAEEFHECNQACAWVGKGTPAFLVK
jgi:hypothetical protein